jgi:hypothetical protein
MIGPGFEGCYYHKGIKSTRVPKSMKPCRIQRWANEQRRRMFAVESL